MGRMIVVSFSRRRTGAYIIGKYERLPCWVQFAGGRQAVRADPGTWLYRSVCPLVLSWFPSSPRLPQPLRCAASERRLRLPTLSSSLSGIEHVSGRSLLNVSFGVRKVALQISRHLDVLALNTAAKRIFKRLPVHPRFVAPREMFVVLPDSRGVAHGN
jgi:hypothetical protein